MNSKEINDIVNGKISISRMNSNDPKFHNIIHLKIENDNYDEIMDIYIKPEQFSLALTGLNCQNCIIERR